MYIILVLAVGLIWCLWLLIANHASWKKVVVLLVGIFLLLAGSGLVFQDAVRADELGQTGNLFGNPLALMLILGGFISWLVLTVLTLRQKNS